MIYGLQRDTHPPRIDKAGQALITADGAIAEGHREWEQAILAAHVPKGPPGSCDPREGGSAFERVDNRLVGVLLGKAANTSAPGDDRISADIVRVFWQWYELQIMQLVRACIRLGHHPELWKMAKGVVIATPGKPGYFKVQAYHVISLPDVISKLVERTAAHLIADHLERMKGRGLPNGQFGCRERRSCAVFSVVQGRTGLWQSRPSFGRTALG